MRDSTPLHHSLNKLQTHLTPSYSYSKIRNVEEIEFFPTLYNNSDHSDDDSTNKYFFLSHADPKARE